MSRASNSVLFVSNFLSAAGFNRGYSEELTDRLETRGWEVTRTSSRPGRVSRMLDMLRTAWRSRARYDVAHVDVFSGPSFVWAESVCFELRRLQKPVILTLRGGNLPEFAKQWPGRVRRLLRAANVVTVPSTYLGEQMREHRTDLTLCRNAIDSTAYGFRERRQLQPHLVWVRAFHEVYNPLLAVDVLRRLIRRFPGARLSMLGPDKDGSLARVEQAARELGVRDRIELVGPVPKSEIPRHLATADLFINTTDADNTPISVLEAMAAGLCVVSTSVGGIPYLLEHERNALLVPRRDAVAMTTALERLLDDPQLASALSRGARELAVVHDWAPVLQQWETTLREVANT